LQHILMPLLLPSGSDARTASAGDGLAHWRSPVGGQSIGGWVRVMLYDCHHSAVLPVGRKTGAALHAAFCQ
jgi:hypothetical protein